MSKKKPSIFNIVDSINSNTNSALMPTINENKPKKKSTTKQNISEFDLKSDSDDDAYDESVESESESEEDIEVENDAEEPEDEDKPEEVDDEDQKKEATISDDEQVDDVEIEEVETETPYTANDDGCMYNFAAKKKILKDDDDDDEDYYDDEVYDDDNIKTNDIVKPEDRITHPVLFKNERVRMLGVRTKQLSLNAKPMIKNTEDLGPKEIARLELKNKVIPFIIERTLPNGKREHFHLHELEINN
jgi:DNA-directed RNA polymerase subunit K/omega